MSQNQPTPGRIPGTDRDFTIVINGRKRTITDPVLSFAEVVALAPDLPSGPNVIFTVTYKRGAGPRPDGTLTEGESVKVQDGMIFNVTATDKS
jgi:hypothetical protein